MEGRRKAVKECDGHHVNLLHLISCRSFSLDRLFFLYQLPCLAGRLAICTTYNVPRQRMWNSTPMGFWAEVFVFRARVPFGSRVYIYVVP